MSFIRTIQLGLRSLFRKNAVEHDLDDELRHFVEMSARQNVRDGMTPEDALRAARMSTGSAEATKETVRSGGWEATIEALVQDVRLAVRGLRRNPAFTLIAVVSLALGIGANTTMFSIVNGVMLRPLPYHDADRLVLLWTDDARRGLHQEATAYATIADWQQQSRTLPNIAYYHSQRITPTSNDPTLGRGTARSAFVSANLFDVLGVAAYRGRLISATDERDRAPVAVISHSFWQRWYGGAPDVVGKQLRIDDASKFSVGSLTVVGVMPPDFYFPDTGTEVWIPATKYWRFEREASERFQPWARRWTAVGRLAPGARVSDADFDLTQIGQRLTAVHTTTVPEFPGFAVTALPVLDSIAGTNLQSALWLLLGAVGLVLLIVCANVANLLLARGAARQHEFAVRRALGARRIRIVRQLIVESLVLGIVGGLVGVGIAALTVPSLAAAASAFVPRMNEVAMDVRVLLFALGASLISGIIFGLIPALRLSAADADSALRDGRRGTAGVRMRRSQGAFVLAQCSLALVLLAGSGLLLKSLSRLNAVNPGFDPSNVLAVRIEFPPDAPPTAEERAQNSDIGPIRARTHEHAMSELTERIRALPGVESVGLVDDMFISSRGNESITIPGRDPSQMPAGELTEAAASPGFFATMRVPLVRGRTLTRDDAAQKIRALWSPLNIGLSLAEKEQRAVPEPVVVNETFAHRYFPGEDPVGRRFCIDPTGKTYWWVIVGVVGDMRRQGLDRTAIAEFYGAYYPIASGRADLLVRSSKDPLAVSAAVRSEILRALPGSGVTSVATAESLLGGFSAQRRLQTWLLAAFAGLALTLAAVGIFGLAHYAAAERTREIGVRVALGATPMDVIRLVVSQGMRMPVAGIATGLVAAAALTRAIAAQLYGVEPTDPYTFAGVAALLLGVAAVACYVAAYRAAHADPVKALRES